MKRKLFSLSLALLAVLTVIPPAAADMIWEPYDSFYEKHREECNYVNRRYQLEGYGGTVTVLTAPGGMSKSTLDNGLRGTIQFTWEEKETAWGYLCWVDDSEVEGWVPMDDLSLVYDSQAFTEDHAAEIVSGEPAAVDFQEAVVYSYPNGPVWEGALKEDRDYQPFSEVFTEIYTDAASLRWGYVGYYMGRLDGWVCLDDPMNTKLDTAVVSVTPSPAQERGSVTVKAGPQLFPVAGGLVAAVVAVTAVLIVKLRKRENQS